MSDMRLIVAGAGGRMGRALTRVISETPGAVLAGALEAPGSELLGKDAGVLAGLPAERRQAVGGSVVAVGQCRRHSGFHRAGRDHRQCRDRGRSAASSTSSAPPAFRRSDDAVIKSVTSRAIVVKSGNMSLGVNLLAALVKRVAQSLDEDFDIEILEMHHNEPRSMRRRAPR